MNYFIFQPLLHKHTDNGHISISFGGRLPAVMDLQPGAHTKITLISRRGLVKML